jgi:hypothetical protein
MMPNALKRAPAALKNLSPCSTNTKSSMRNTMFAVSKTRRVFLSRSHAYVKQNPSGLTSTRKQKVQR